VIVSVMITDLVPPCTHIPLVIRWTSRLHPHNEQSAHLLYSRGVFNYCYCCCTTTSHAVDLIVLIVNKVSTRTAHFFTRWILTFIFIGPILKPISVIYYTCTVCEEERLYDRFPVKNISVCVFCLDGKSCRGSVKGLEKGSLKSVLLNKLPQ
jgi:hypothetical protein